MAKNFRNYFHKSIPRDVEYKFAAWDVETVGLGGELLIISYAYEQEDEIISGLLEGENMVQELITLMTTMPGHTWYAHNAQYDFRYIMNYLKTCGMPFTFGMRTNNSMYEIRIELPGHSRKNRRVLVLRDSLALWAGTLKTLTKNFGGPDGQKAEIDDILSFDTNRQDHREYARQDSVALCVAMRNLNTEIKTLYGVTIRSTSASTAMAAWESQIEDAIGGDSNPAQEAFFRDCYHGGLVFLTDNNLHKSENGEHVAETYDINSSYPAVMRESGVPMGKISNTRNYDPNEIAFLRVEVESPANLSIPILPTRDKRGNMAWRAGRFWTNVTTLELNFALENGYILHECKGGYSFEFIGFPFSDFVDKAEKIRAGYKGKPQEGLAKLMQNSLYGKFGSRRERSTVFHPRSDIEEIGAIPLDESETSDNYWWVKKETSNEMRTKVAWAAWITANARLKLLKNIYNIGVENVIYGDTDSITIKSGFSEKVDVGIAYGQFKLEKSWLIFRACGAKLYAGLTTENKTIGAAKGLNRNSMNSDRLNEIINDGFTQVQALSLPSFKATLSKGVKSATMVSRKSSSLENSKNFQDIGNGKIILRRA